MKRNCTLLVLLLTILLCVGCSNPSDKVEGNLPPVDSGETGYDLMATPADVLRNLVPQVNTASTMSRSLVPSENLTREALGKKENVQAFNSMASITPRVSELFYCILSNEFAPLVEGMDFDDFPKKGYTPEKEIVYSTATRDMLLSTCNNDERFVDDFLNKTHISNVKVTSSDNSAYVHFLVISDHKSCSNNECEIIKNPMYCIVKCTLNEFHPVFDIEFIALDIATFQPEDAPGRYTVITSNLKYGEDSSESYMIQVPYTKDSSEKWILSNDNITMKEKIDSNKDGKTYYMNRGGMEMASFVSKDSGGCGYLTPGKTFEIFDSNLNLIYYYLPSQNQEESKDSHLIHDAFVLGDIPEANKANIKYGWNQNEIDFLKIDNVEAIDAMENIPDAAKTTINHYKSHKTMLSEKLADANCFKTNWNFISITENDIIEWYNILTSVEQTKIPEA